MPSKKNKILQHNQKLFFWKNSKNLPLIRLRRRDHQGPAEEHDVSRAAGRDRSAAWHCMRRSPQCEGRLQEVTESENVVDVMNDSG